MKVKFDFKIDMVTGDAFDVKEWKTKLSQSRKRKNGNYYYSEVSDYYHTITYGKRLIDFIPDDMKVPKCPITEGLPSHKLKGSIVFGTYSESCSAKEIADYITHNNKDYKKHVERMKIERRGEGNPMYGADAWNKGLTKETDATMKKISEDRKGIQFSEETLKKMSDSAKAREVHGHTGHKHSKETKQRLRKITAQRYKDGVYSHNTSKPH